MIKLSEPTLKTGQNAWGARTSNYQHDEKVEDTDVGTKRPHYLGWNHREYQFKDSDVGRTITVYSDHAGWTCWSFAS